MSSGPRLLGSVRQAGVGEVPQLDVEPLGELALRVWQWQDHWDNWYTAKRDGGVIYTVPPQVLCCNPSSIAMLSLLLYVFSLLAVDSSLIRCSSVRVNLRLLAALVNFVRSRDPSIWP